MTALKLFIFVCSSIGYFRIFARQPEIGPYKAPFICCSLISLTLFFFAILGHLKIGLIFVTAVGFVLLVLDMKSCSILGTLTSLAPKKMPAYLIGLPFIIYYICIKGDFKFLLWDEFSFWLSSAKFIFETNALFDEHSPIYVKSYPPIQQLFQYYFTSLTSWSEKHVLYAQTFWVLSALLCVSGCLIRSPANIALSFLLSTSALYLFNYSFSTIYSDPLLGVAFAACVALAWDQRNRLNTTVTFFISVGALLLLKEIAILLAAISISIFTISLWSGRNPHQGVTHTARQVLAPILVGLMSLFVILKSWSWYVAAIKATRETTIPNFSDFLNGPLHNRLLTTTTEFWLRIKKSGYLIFADNPVSVGPSILALTILLTIVSLVLIAIHSDAPRAKRLLALAALWGGAFAYTAALFLSYLVVFTEYEGVRLASFERYLSSYMLAWLLIVCCLCVAAIEQRAKLGCVVIQAAIACVALYFLPKTYTNELKSIESAGPVFQLRQELEAYADKVKSNMKSDQRVYFVAQNSNGLERVIFYYAMLPYQSSMSWCWSLGKKYFDGDVWTCDVKLASLLKDYDYLAVYRGDQNLIDSADKLLSGVTFDKTSRIFKIQKDDHGITAIHPLP